MPCYNSLCADDEADRLADQDDAEQALERRRSEIENEARTELMGTLADGTGDLSDLVEAIDEHQMRGGLESLALIDALRNNPAKLMRWAVEAIDKAAKARAEAYTMGDLEADALTAEAP